MNFWRCVLCKNAIRKNQNSIFCDISDHWVHAKCTILSTFQFKVYKMIAFLGAILNVSLMPFHFKTSASQISANCKSTRAYTNEPRKTSRTTADLNKLFHDDALLSNANDHTFTDLFDIFLTFLKKYSLFC